MKDRDKIILASSGYHSSQAVQVTVVLPLAAVWTVSRTPAWQTSLDAYPSNPTHSAASVRVWPGTCVTLGTTHSADTVPKLRPDGAVIAAPDQLVEYTSAFRPYLLAVRRHGRRSSRSQLSDPLMLGALVCQ